MRGTGKNQRRDEMEGGETEEAGEGEGRGRGQGRQGPRAAMRGAQGAWGDGEEREIGVENLSL